MGIIFSQNRSPRPGNICVLVAVPSGVSRLGIVSHCEHDAF